MSKIFSISKSLFLIFATVLLISQATLAAFTDTATITGNVFTTGTTDLKLLQNLAGPYNASNYVDPLAGTSFDNIYPGWTERYPLKVVNTGTLNMTLQSYANYVAGNSTLADYITVTIRAWNDGSNGNPLDGIVQAGEVTDPYGVATLTRWQNTTFGGGATQNPFGDLGQINVPDPVRGFVFDFEASSTMPNTLQGQSLTLDFVMNGTTEGAPQQ
jgi:predicted ribosomally synthesized peptide with SipW-like signal peptide